MDNGIKKRLVHDFPHEYLVVPIKIRERVASLIDQYRDLASKETEILQFVALQTDAEATEFLDGLERWLREE